MARVTAAEVKTLTGSVLPDATVDLFITPANLIVDDLNAKCGKSFDEPRLKQIELFLSAHFLTDIDQSLALESEDFENRRSNRHLRDSQMRSWLRTTNQFDASDEGSKRALPKRSGCSIRSW